MLLCCCPYEGMRYTATISVVPGVTSINGVDIRTLLPASAVAQLGPATIPFTEDQYFGKIDFEPGDKDRLEFTVKVRNETQTDDVGVGRAKSDSIGVINDETRFSLRWQHSGEPSANEGPS